MAHLGVGEVGDHLVQLSGNAAFIIEGTEILKAKDNFVDLRIVRTVDVDWLG